MILKINITQNTFKNILEIKRDLDKGIAYQIQTAIKDQLTSDIYSQIGIDNVKRLKLIANTHEDLSLKNILDKQYLQVTFVHIDMTIEKGIQIDHFSSNENIIFGHFDWKKQINESAPTVVKKELKTVNKYSIKAGLLIDSSVFEIFRSEINICRCENRYLSPSQSFRYRTSVLFFMCWICGETYICHCYKDIIGKITDDKKAELPKFKIKSSICHLCSERPSKENYAGYYARMIHKIEDIPFLTARNDARRKLGIPLIGERWKNETTLYKMIVSLYPQYTIRREHSPDWLRKQRFDIFIVELNIAIEYQGEQHFRPVSLFGGEEGFERTKERDVLKRKLSKQNGVEIIFIKYNQRITESLITYKVDEIIRNRNRSCNID